MRKLLLLACLFAFIITYISCSSKGGGGGPTDPCSGVTITVSGTVTNTSGPGQNNGSISASASGSSGLTFSINGGAFQSSGNFTGLAAGTYTITAKNNSGCSGSATFTISNGDPCVGLSFTVGGNATNATPCLATPNGSLTITTSGGGSGFTYNINGGAYQSSATFTNLVAGTYTVGAKEAGGCVKTASVTINATAPGTLFAPVKVIINTNCAISGCHSGTIPAGGIDFTQDCNIVANAVRIKVRAVDSYNTINQMPPPPSPGLSLADRNTITAWVNAGGSYTN
jgi:hypothetical protein